MKANKVAETPAISTKQEGRVKQHNTDKSEKAPVILVTGKPNKAYERYTKNRMMRLKALERKQETFVARVQKEFPEMTKEEILTFWNKHNKPQPKKEASTKPYWTKSGLESKQTLAQLRKDRTRTIEFVDSKGVTRTKNILLNVVRVYNKATHISTWSIEEAKKRFEDRAARRAERLVMQQKVAIEINSKVVDKPKVKKTHINVIIRRMKEDGSGLYDFLTQPAQTKKAAEKIALNLYPKYNNVDSSFDSIICAEYDVEKKINVPFKVVKKDSVEQPKVETKKKKPYVPMKISVRKDERVYTDPVEILNILKKNPIGTIKNLPLAIKREVSKYGYIKTVNKYQSIVDGTAIAA